MTVDVWLIFNKTIPKLMVCIFIFHAFKIQIVFPKRNDHKKEISSLPLTWVWCLWRCGKNRSRSCWMCHFDTWWTLRLYLGLDLQAHLPLRFAELSQMLTFAAERNSSQINVHLPCNIMCYFYKPFKLCLLSQKKLPKFES